MVDVGHSAYWLRRGRPGMLLMRFDWFVGLTDAVVQGERRKFAIRSLAWVVVIGLCK